MRKFRWTTLVAAVMFGVAYWLTANGTGLQDAICVPRATVIKTFIEFRPSPQYPSLLRFFDSPDGMASKLIAAAAVTSRLSLPKLSLCLREAQKFTSTLTYVKLAEEIPWN